MIVGADTYGYDIDKGYIPNNIMHVDFHDHKFL